MKKFYFLAFIALFSFALNAQSIVYSDGFEPSDFAYVDGADLVGVNNWQVFNAAYIAKSINNIGNGADASDWYGEISTGGFTQVQKVFGLVAGQTYEFKLDVKRTNGNNAESQIQVFELGTNTTLITESNPAMTNDWAEKLVTFTANASVNHGFRLRQTGTSFIQFDNMEITCTSCPPLSVNDNDAFEFSAYPNPVKDVLKFKVQEPIVSAKAFDILGKEVLSIQQPRESINVSSLSKGLYVLKLEAENGAQVTRKIIKE